MMGYWQKISWIVFLASCWIGLLIAAVAAVASVLEALHGHIVSGLLWAVGWVALIVLGIRALLRQQRVFRHKLAEDAAGTQCPDQS